LEDHVPSRPIESGILSGCVLLSTLRASLNLAAQAPSAPDPSTVIYQATVDEPTVYTKPWTVGISMSKRTDRIFEYACHEGN
jgi:hypothetical protein